MSTETHPPSHSPLPGLTDGATGHHAWFIGGPHGAQDDTAVIIGLALSYARQGHGSAASVPAPVLVRLFEHAARGNAACRLVQGWLEARPDGGSRQVAPSDVPAAIPHAAPAVIIAAHMPEAR